eukprot:gene2400-1503_t
MGGKKEMHKKTKERETAVSRHFRLHCESDLFAQSDFYFFHDLLRSAMPAPENCTAMGGEMIRNGKGKEKQLFRGIFAFIANRDLFAQSDFYFFHDSLRSAMPAPEKLYRLRRTFGWWVSCRRAPAPEACDAAPSMVKKNICVEAIEPTRNGKGKEKQLFRGIFAFIANRDLFAQSDFYFFHDSLRSAMPAPEKLYRLRRSFGGGFMPARPPQKPATQPQKQLFRGIFAFIANRDLFAQSDFYFFHDSLRSAMPAPEKLYRLRRTLMMVSCRRAPPQKPATQPRRCRRMPTGTNYFLTALGENAGIAPAAGRVKKNICVEAMEPTSHGVEKRRCIRNEGKEKQLFRGIFAFIANRDLFESDFYFSTIRYAPPCRRQKIVQVEKKFWWWGKEKQLFRGIFAFIANRDLFAQSDFYFSTIRYARHAGARKLYRLRRTLMMGFMPARARPRRRSPVDPWGGKKEMHKKRGKRNSCFAAFSPSLRIGICLPNQISIFSTIRYAPPCRRQKNCTG